MAIQVSVVLPVHQRQQDGLRALQSALAQEVEGLEVIVVDDGSTPPFLLPQSLRNDPRVRLVRRPGNAGAAAARNLGVRLARGAWIAFLDSDDLWHAGKLRAQLARAAAAARLTVIVTGYRRIELATAAARDLVPIASRDPADFACGCWFSPGSTALVPRYAFSEVGPFDENLERLEDLDWYLRLALAGGGTEVVPRIAATVNVGPRAAHARVLRALASLRRKWLAADAECPLPAALARNLAAALALEEAAACWFDRRFGAFASALARSLVARPRLRLHLRTWWQEPSTPAAGDQ